MSARPAQGAAAATVSEARRSLARSFREAALEAPDVDARVLVQHALGIDHARLVSAGARALGEAERRRIRRLGERRLAREPVAHIVGAKEFWGLTLRVTPATLVPRPETETVVEAALTALDATGGRARPLRIADLGAGSGALLLALLRELPAARGLATDVSAAALAVARENAERLGLSARAMFCAADFGAALAHGFDLIVSNPPYIASGEIPTLPPEIRQYEPVLALDGGPDGLDAYRAIAAEADRLLAEDGRLVVELGIGQEAAVAGVFAAAGLSTFAPAVRDLAGVPRALVLGRRARLSRQ